MTEKKIIYITMAVIMIMITIPTIYKIEKQHRENQILVVKKEISYQAKRCYNKDECTSSTIYLKDLYEKNYLKEKLINPQTKKYYKEDSYINLETNEIVLNS